MGATTENKTNTASKATPKSVQIPPDKWAGVPSFPGSTSSHSRSVGHGWEVRNPNDIRQNLVADWLPVSALRGALPHDTADLMIENTIGTLSLPVGVCPTLVVNGVRRVVPVMTEEPSVVAALCAAGKLVAKSGGFSASASDPVMTAQVQLRDVGIPLAEAKAAIEARETELVALANTTACAGMAKRGGGVRGLEVRRVKDYLVVHIHVDVCEAMGANCVNTVAEALSAELCATADAAPGLRILTNLCDKRTATASFRAPVHDFAYRGAPGRRVCEGVVSAWEFARDDPYRAATHNKGVMNGVVAVALACGQDTRALEAGAHAFAATRGEGYRPLTEYHLEEGEEGGFLCGRIEMPMAVGTVGGALSSNPDYRASLRLMAGDGPPIGAKGLAETLAAVGLAQNLAALRALATTGIQDGHMRLHRRKSEPNIRKSAKNDLGALNRHQSMPSL